MDLKIRERKPLLVLSRKRGEQIFIRPEGNEAVTLQPGEQIEIMLVEVRMSGVARIGITADKTRFKIVREELDNQVPREVQSTPAKS